MRRTIVRFAHDRRAATAVEYTLIAALIALVVIAGMGSAFRAIAGQFNVVSNNLGPT